MNGWIRHPFLRAGQLVLLAVSGSLAFAVHSRAHPAPAGVEFSLSVWGEYQEADGTWRGVDLLAHPDRSADRFQVAVTPVAPARVQIDEVGPLGERRLYPEPGQTGVVAGGRTWALPGVNAFYPLPGALRLRVTVFPVDDGAVGAAAVFGSPGLESVVLSDGKPEVVRAQLYRAEHGGVVEVKGTAGR